MHAADAKTCPRCQGRGFELVSHPLHSVSQSIRTTCPLCNGYGKLPRSPHYVCPRCNVCSVVPSFCRTRISSRLLSRRHGISLKVLLMGSTLCLKAWAIVCHSISPLTPSSHCAIMFPNHFIFKEQILYYLLLYHFLLVDSVDSDPRAEEP